MQPHDVNERVRSSHKESSPFIHPKALVESDQIAPGTRIWAFAHVMKNAQIGAGCNICDHAFVESNAKLGNNVTVKNGVAIWDGVEIEDDVFLGPSAVFTNDPNPRAEIKKTRAHLVATLIRRGATIGANATIVCGITIGRYAFVAAGATVAEDVPDHALVMGVPARQKGWMCFCASRLRPVDAKNCKCPSCGRMFRRQKSGLEEVLSHSKDGVSKSKTLRTQKKEQG
jgi:UDP-2-acetamido-3-amino-2,3-dideoxy-glucuronate N-acetyltransferase